MKKKQELVLLPIEVTELAQKVSALKQEEVNTVLNQIFTGTASWDAQVDAIEVTSINDVMQIQLADVARKNVKNARLSAEKIFDAKRDEVQQIKVEFDLEDKLWLKAKQVMQLKFKAIEEKAEWKANFVKRYEAEQKELKTQIRIEKVVKFKELNRIEFENMNDEMFNLFIGGLEKEHNDRIEAEQKAESEIIARKKAEQERIEAQRLENDRLKKEAEQKEKELEAERKKQAEILAKQKAESDEKARIEAEKQSKIQDELIEKAESERKEKERIELELKAKKEAELKAEQQRIEAENIAKKEADKLAKAPIKKQLELWVNSFALPNCAVNNETSKEIALKFDAFKNWSKIQINNL